MNIRTSLLFVLSIVIAYSCNNAEGSASEQREKYVLVVHGGAGTITRQNMTPEREAQYRSGLEAALLAGYQIIQDGGDALDAVEAAVRILEDDSLFNAGKGAVFTNDGRNELDASIMYGKNRMAGSVAGVTIIKNPITAARAVMEKSEHVMLAGRGAELFAMAQNIDTVPPSYFRTEPRWRGLQRSLRNDSLRMQNQTAGITPDPDRKFGTVGCVARDKNGNLAAGTSTGGMNNKKYGRIGDAPIIGAGTFADNNTVAVSCTGWGEFYIRNVVAYDVSALMEYKNMPLSDAASAVIKKVGDAGGNGGLIALDKNGNMAMPFNTEGMYRGAITESGKMEIYFYKD